MSDVTRILLLGGPAHGREEMCSTTAQTLRIPVFSRRVIDEDGMPCSVFDQLVYTLDHAAGIGWMAPKTRAGA